jgi:hypothetical protein
MARNTQGLTARQSKFLNALAQGHATTGQVERQLRLAPYTLRRWMDQPKFVVAWRQTNELLKLRATADTAILTARIAAETSTPEKAPDDANVPTPPPAESVPEAPPRPRHEPAPRAPKSDRDLIRLRHGEEAARAFDELLRAHRPPPGEAASAAGSPPSPVPAATPPPSS